jgi:hypothetical protein
MSGTQTGFDGALDKAETVLNEVSTDVVSAGPVAAQAVSDVTALANSHAALTDRVAAGEDLVSEILAFLRHLFPGAPKLP